MAMKCADCGIENPPQAAYCMSCGSGLVTGHSGAVEPTGQFVAAQAQATMRKMLETPGTIVLAGGLLLLLVSILLMVVRHWGSGIGLFVVSIIILWVAVQWRGHEAAIAASQASLAPRVEKSEVREHEIVKVKCRYCGVLNPDGARNCDSCGAVL